MYKGVRDIFRRYWRAYGGLVALIRSPYLHLALFLTLITGNEWWNKEWWIIVINVIPSLLGFTLGGFAIFISFGDEKFRSLLIQVETNDESSSSAYVGLCSTFVHFIIVQTLSLLCAIVIPNFLLYLQWLKCEIAAFCLNKIFSFLGYFVFLYALTSMLAATMHVFRIAYMFSEHHKYQQKKPSENEE